MGRGTVAISPVISTVIIVALVVPLVIVVAYWTVGVAFGFTRFERLEFTNAYVDRSGSEFNVTLQFRNAGTVGIRLETVLLNSRSWTSYPAGTVYLFRNSRSALSDALTDGILAQEYFVETGEAKEMVVWIREGGGFTGGMVVEVCLRASDGKEFSRPVQLP